MAVTKNPTIIFITHVIPYPPAAGNEIRILKLITWLRGRGYRTILLLKVHSLPAEVRAGLEEVVDAVHCLHEMTDDLTPPVPGQASGFFRKLLGKAVDVVARNRLSNGTPNENRPEDIFKRKSSALKKSLCPDKLIRLTRQLCSKYAPAAVIAEYIFTAPCLDVVPGGTLKLIDTHDMFSRKKEEVHAHGLDDLLHCTREEERDYLLKGDVIIAIQEDEAALFQDLVPERKIVTVRVDYDVVPEVDTCREQADTVLVVGSDNPLNVHGLAEFYEHAWPLVRAEVPHAILRIVGKVGTKFSPEDSSVSISGWVENLDDEYRRACVVINPTVAGTGLKIKSVEALCKAKAFVGTPNSVEGLFFDGDPPLLVGRDWPEFADEIVRLLKTEGLRRSLQEDAFKYAHERFDAGNVYRPLVPFFPVSTPAGALSEAGGVSEKA
jgi:glycosyltransferase involved in cell wall biosynthesis